MTSDEKTSLAEIVAGDEVAYRGYGARNIYQRQQVDRTTPTQIILFGNQRFRRQDGGAIGGLRFRSDTIHALGDRVTGWDRISRGIAKDGPLTYAQLVELEQAAEQERQRREDLADWIRNRLAKMQIGEVTTAQLEQAAQMLGYESD